MSGRRSFLKPKWETLPQESINYLYLSIMKARQEGELELMGDMDLPLVDIPLALQLKLRGLMT